MWVQLTLPPAFGSAYVGETFACTICANNEVRKVNNDDSSPTITDVGIGAEMQTPTTTVSLTLDPPNVDDEGVLSPGQTLQKIVRFDLKEPGNHVLVITVTYTETVAGGADGGSGGGGDQERVRTFRKLYQFLAQQSLAVRTKTVEMSVEGGSGDGKARASSRYLLEAQLENVSEDLMTLEVCHTPSIKFHFHPAPFISPPPKTMKEINGETDNRPHSPCPLEIHIIKLGRPTPIPIYIYILRKHPTTDPQPARGVASRFPDRESREKKRRQTRQRQRRRRD